MRIRQLLASAGMAAAAAFVVGTAPVGAQTASPTIRPRPVQPPGQLTIPPRSATLPSSPVAPRPALPPFQPSRLPTDVPFPSQPMQPAQPLTLTQALQTARQNLDVTLSNATLAATRADIVAANRRPYPVLSAKAASIDLQNGVGPGNVLTEKRIDKSVGIDWTIERGNKRELRTIAARRIADAAEADVADVRVQQQLGALGAYFDLLAAQQRIAEVQEIARSAAGLAVSARRRVDAGDLAAQEALRIEIEAQRARIEQRTVALERERAAIVLGQFLGAPSPLALVASSDWPASDAAERAAVDVAALVEQRADVRAADARFAAAQALLESAQATRKADVTVGASFNHFPGVSNRMVELRAQIPLFWGYAQQGEIARAQALLGQAESAASRTRYFASAELQRLRQEALSAAARTRSYESDILPRARRVAEQAEFAFSRGASSLTDVLDARRTLRATLLEALAARAEHAKSDGAWQLRTQPTVFGLPPLEADLPPGGAAASPAGYPATALPPVLRPATGAGPAGAAVSNPATAVPGASVGPGRPVSPGAPAAGPATPGVLVTPDASAGVPTTTATPPPTTATPAPLLVAPSAGPAPAPSPRPADAAATTPLRGR